MSDEERRSQLTAAVINWCKKNGMRRYHAWLYDAIELLLEGYSITEVAEVLDVSRMSIQHYIDAMKRCLSV